VLTFVGFLEELERNHQTVVIPGEELERLVNRFGPVVREIGVWQQGGEGSIELSTANIAAAARIVGDSVLTGALQQLKSPDEISGVLRGSSHAAERLIEELHRLYRDQFERKVQRYQDTPDPAEAGRLWREISSELFGA
jgi:hypothetical protein